MASDLFYKSDEYLIRQVSYNKQRANEYAMRAKAAQDELDRRHPPAAQNVGKQRALEIDIRNRLLNGQLRLYPYQAEMAREIVSSPNPGYVWTKVPRGTGRTIISIAVDLLRSGHMITIEGYIK